MMAAGFEEVYHLKGGILKYLEEIPQAQSLWRGECFVFDQRIALGHGLSERDKSQSAANIQGITDATEIDIGEQSQDNLND